MLSPAETNTVPGLVSRFENEVWVEFLEGRALEADDPRKGRIVNLRYFAGLTAEETAAALDVSVGTVEREWRYIKAWLHTQLAEGDDSGAAPDEDEG